MDTSAQTTTGYGGRVEASVCPTVTVVLHPDPGRLGERASLHRLGSGVPLALSRTSPAFVGGGHSEARPLSDPRVSRSPLWIQQVGDALCFMADGRCRATVDGQPVDGTHRVPVARLNEPGLGITLGGAVLLWLMIAPPVAPERVAQGIVGVSPPIVSLRERIGRAAVSPYPVLIRGPTGSGKELVARAVHGACQRRGAFVAVNMAALPASVASSELFGHGKGAFTGAAAGARGRITQAEGGTLFLDEIGETPPDVQPQLLRFLDSGEVQPLGEAARRVEVKVVAATDADLEARVAAGSFSAALLYRLQASCLWVPPLAARPIDVPLLLHAFLLEGLKAVGATHLLSAPPPARPWLSAELALRLARLPFEGNVRELRNIAVELALHAHDLPRASLPSGLEARVDVALGPGDVPVSPPPAARGVAALSDRRVWEILLAVDWNVTQAARELGVARNTLTAYMGQMEGIVLPNALEAEVIEEALGEVGGDVPAAARALRVSAHGLRMRMNALGL